MTRGGSSPSFAVVGCGSIAEVGILPHLQLRNALPRALFDIAPQRVTALAERYGVPVRYTEYERLLDDPTIDALLIASPIHLHYSQALAALRAGKHVYVQKTMTEHASQADELIDVARRNGLVLAASPGQLLLPVFAYAKALMEERRIGTPYGAVSLNWGHGHEREATRADTSNPALNPRWYYQPGGGPMRDMGIYALHVLIGLFGDVDQVFAHAGSPVAVKHWGDTPIPVETPDNYAVSLRFRDGTLAQVSTGFCSAPPVGWGFLSIAGSAGAIDIRRTPAAGSHYELSLRDDAGEVQHQTFGSGLGEVADQIGESHVALDILDFLDAIRSGNQPGASPQTARQSIAVVEAIERSGRDNRPVAVETR